MQREKPLFHVTVDFGIQSVLMQGIWLYRCHYMENNHHYLKDKNVLLIISTCTFLEDFLLLIVEL